jgi:NAD(P)-dependent dehydrogenase (short-subunit alcohol dehydrogenase family)
MPGPLADKTAFVTAAGQGIGRATALAFAAIEEGVGADNAEVPEVLFQNNVDDVLMRVTAHDRDGREVLHLREL